MKKAGNAIVALLGGREVHPINVRVGGFYRAPSKAELETLTEKLKWGRDAALETVRWVSAFSFPDFERDYEYVALRHDGEYPFNEGRIVSSKGLDIAPVDFDAHFSEEHVPHSNALHCVINNRGAYLTGPLARFNLNFDRLPPLAREAAAACGLDGRCANPFKSIVVRSIEVLFAFDEALRLIERYEVPDRPAEPAQPRAGTGCACTEAPRGMLYHRYRIDAQGAILDAKIVPPTSQNQKSIEADLWNLVPKHADLSNDQLASRCEQAIRNHDPCISCATHFLKLNVERT
jgi:coenzyme F420-reducing hydrogenase alpha subunit